MQGDKRLLALWLTKEEADELLSRCLESQEQDTPAFQTALLRLAEIVNKVNAENQDVRAA